MGYTGVINDNNCSFDAKVSLEKDNISIETEKGSMLLDYSSITDIHLLNYHVLIDTESGRTDLCQLGHKTEDFFENLWNMYNSRIKEAVFLEGKSVYSAEGEFELIEGDLTKKGTAKIALFERALLLLPHNIFARRIPLCFCTDIEKDGFKITIKLDTGETYIVSRLGYDTEDFFEKLMKLKDESVSEWEEAHKELEKNLSDRLGEREENYQAAKLTGAEMICGLFSPEDEGFWFAAVKGGKALVELVTGEKTATYLYKFSEGKETFISAIRHAMEMVGRNREIIYIDEEDLKDKPLYKMVIDRSSQVRFLRAHNDGRIIHNAAWKNQAEEYLK